LEGKGWLGKFRCYFHRLMAGNMAAHQLFPVSSLHEVKIIAEKNHDRMAHFSTAIWHQCTWIKNLI